MKVSRGFSLVFVSFALFWGTPVTSHVMRRSVTADPGEEADVEIVDEDCDNGKWRLNLDWDNSNNYDYTCQTDESLRPVFNINPLTECIPDDHMPLPLHKCMTDIITYDDQPPRAGPHRPLWPVYGEYQYVPPQRWLHSLEHGAVVFLYHPCADPVQIKLLKDIGRSCLRRHIISPYRQMPAFRSFGVLTYGCRLLMDIVDPSAIIEYVRDYALRAPERTAKDGQYMLGLLHRAAIISDIKDSGPLCPRTASFFKKRLLSKKKKAGKPDTLEDFLKEDEET